MKLYSIEKYGEVYINDSFNPNDYNKVWYIYNESDDLVNKPANEKYDKKVLKKGSKVIVVDAEGWWYIAFKSEDGKEAYYIFYTQAGIT